MGLIKLLEKAYSKLDENLPQIMDTLYSVNDYFEKQYEEMEKKIDSKIETYQELPLKVLNNELSRLNNSNCSSGTIKKTAITKIINERNDRINYFVRKYSELSSSTLKWERTNVINGRANFYTEPFGCQEITKVEAEIRIIAIDKLLSERKNGEY